MVRVYKKKATKGVLSELNLSYFQDGLVMTNQGLDYLRVAFDRPISFFTYIFSKIDTDNSNSYFDGILTYTKIQTAFGLNLEIYTSYMDESYKIIQFQQFLWKKISNSKKARIDFYGVLFRLIEKGHFEEEYISAFLDSVSNEDPQITRIDYKIDYFYNFKKAFPEILTIVGKLEHAGHKIRNSLYKVGEDGNSWNFGRKTTKAMFLRCYDKLIQTETIGTKRFLYNDYHEFASVFRLELEMNHKVCNMFSYSEIDQLIDKAKAQLKQIPKGDYKMFLASAKTREINTYNDQEYTQNYVKRGEKLQTNGYNQYVLTYKHLSDPVHFPDQTQHEKTLSQFFDYVGKDLSKKQKSNVQYGSIPKSFQRSNNS